jgi:adenylate kinase
MIVALTGTPGTGKSSVSKFLSKVYQVKSVSDLAEEFGCIADDTYAGESVLVVDVGCLSEKVSELEFEGESGEEVLVIEGHLAHLLPCDVTVVLRCNPLRLKDRLLSRWDMDKVLENVEAELLDVILVEAMEKECSIYEIDTTNRTPEGVAGIVVELIESERRGEGIPNFRPGKIDWIAEVGERIDEVIRPTV